MRIPGHRMIQVAMALLPLLLSGCMSDVPEPLTEGAASNGIRFIAPRLISASEGEESIDLYPFYSATSAGEYTAAGFSGVAGSVYHLSTFSSSPCEFTPSYSSGFYKFLAVGRTDLSMEGAVYTEGSMTLSPSPAGETLVMTTQSGAPAGCDVFTAVTPVWQAGGTSTLEGDIELERVMAGVGLYVVHIPTEVKLATYNFYASDLTGWFTSGETKQVGGIGIGIVRGTHDVDLLKGTPYSSQPEQEIYVSQTRTYKSGYYTSPAFYLEKGNSEAGGLPLFSFRKSDCLIYQALPCDDASAQADGFFEPVEAVAYVTPQYAPLLDSSFFDTSGVYEPYTVQYPEKFTTLYLLLFDTGEAVIASWPILLGETSLYPLEANHFYSVGRKDQIKDSPIDLLDPSVVIVTVGAPWQEEVEITIE